MQMVGMENKLLLHCFLLALSVSGTAALPAALQAPSMRAGTPRTWGSLIKQEPSAKGTLLYCNLIKSSPSDCANKFLPAASAPGAAYTSAVSLQAAATCLDRQNLGYIDSVMAMFHVDTQKASHYASGSGLEAPPKGYQWDWSDEARDKAESIGKKQGKGANWAEAHVERIQKNEDRLKNDDTSWPAFFLLVEVLSDIWDNHKAGQEARDDPSSVNVPPDRIKPETPPAQDSNPHDSPPPEPESEDVPEGTPTMTNTAFEGDTMDVDLSPEIEETPVMQDETTRTAMQACQESEETKLWKEIGSTEIDPNFFEDDGARANQLKQWGVCDKDYYGDAACKEWQQSLHTAGLRPEDQEAMDEYLKNHPRCPVNIVSPPDCQKAKQEVFKRYAFPDYVEPVINNIFKPGKAMPWKPHQGFTPVVGGSGTHVGAGLNGDLPTDHHTAPPARGSGLWKPGTKLPGVEPTPGSHMPGVGAPGSHPTPCIKLPGQPFCD